MPQIFIDKILFILALFIIIYWFGFSQIDEFTSPKSSKSAKFAGTSLLKDSKGNVFNKKPYQRIVALSATARDILYRIASPEQIVAVSDHGFADRLDSHRFDEILQISSTSSIESLINLGPDLVLNHSIGEGKKIDRLQEAGLEVFDLGSLSGLPSFLKQIRMIGQLSGYETWAESDALAFEARIHHVAADIPIEKRMTGLFLSLYNRKIYGGTRGTSYHDVLKFAGLKDAAAKRFRGWVVYGAEQVIMLNPEVIVTEAGMAWSLCQQDILRRLSVCQTPEKIIELNSNLFSDAGYGMLEASEFVRKKVYGYSQ